jgi:DNA (cytosine-5)-methyltransferase 1
VHEAVKAFVSLGYAVRVEKVYAHEYGIPQRRKRVLIIGNRIGIDFKFPEPTILLKGRIFRNSNVTLQHTIGSLPEASNDQKAEIHYETDVSNQLEDYLRGSSQTITEHSYPKQSPVQQDRIRCLKSGQTMKDLPAHLQHESFNKRANRRVMDGTPTEKRGGSPSGLKRLIYDEPCLTITGAATREFIHPIYDRPLTIRECARIQTFPDDFKFLGSASEKIQQIGNAIPPLIGRIFAEHIRDEYGFIGQITQKGRFISYSVTKAEAMSPALKKTCVLLDGVLNNFSQGDLWL